jgi:hypothetical protein
VCLLSRSLPSPSCPHHTSTAHGPCLLVPTCASPLGVFTPPSETCGPPISTPLASPLPSPSAPPNSSPACFSHPATQPITPNPIQHPLSPPPPPIPFTACPSHSSPGEITDTISRVRTEGGLLLYLGALSGFKGAEGLRHLSAITRLRLQSELYSLTSPGG